jgi:hypothetical protein
VTVVVAQLSPACHVIFVHMQDYIVYSLPPSLQELVRNVGEFGLSQRADFIRAYLYDGNLAVSDELKRSLGPDCSNLLPIASRLITFAHGFVETAGMHRVKVRLHEVV